MADPELRDVATKCMLRYLQNWGQTVDERIAALNETVASAGVLAEFKQDPDGTNPHWSAYNEAHGELAMDFRRKLSSVWCGEFNQEVRNIEILIVETRLLAKELERPEQLELTPLSLETEDRKVL
jgi:hypothetical protein